MKKNYNFILNAKRWKFVQIYRQRLIAGTIEAGNYFEDALHNDEQTIEEMTDKRFLEILVRTKKPQIFAESEIRGGTHDWNNTDLAILGDVTFTTDVTIFDDGKWNSPKMHNPVIQGTLIYVPGALLRGKILTADMHECTLSPTYDVKDIETTANRSLLKDNLYGLLKRRLLSALMYANNRAVASGFQALVTIPGIGCGQFAGNFGGQIKPVILSTLRKLLVDYDFPGISGIWFDPYSEGKYSMDTIKGVRLICCPMGSNGKWIPQLSNPKDFGLSRSRLYSIVAWDHVSWPGNDFFTMGRYTDDGVKTAATDAMHHITGTEGAYNLSNNKYEPPISFKDWEEIANATDVQLHVKDNLIII